MDDSVTNDTIFESGGESLKHFPRPVTIAAAVCAIIFSVVGVAGKIQFLYISILIWNKFHIDCKFFWNSKLIQLIRNFLQKKKKNIFMKWSSREDSFYKSSIVRKGFRNGGRK